jgi:hypothetical protein
MRDEAQLLLNRSTQIRGKLPIQIALSQLPVRELQLSRGGVRDFLLGAFEESIADLDLYQRDFVAADLAHDDGVLLLLDGLDEVPFAGLERAATFLRLADSVMSEIGPRNSLIVTARPQVLAHIDPSTLDRFDIVVLAPFSTAGIYGFLERWPFNADRAAAVSRVFRTLSDAPTLLDTCRNPLALSMYVAFDERQQFSQEPVSDVADYLMPETRASFFRILTDELLVRRQQRARGRLPVSSPVKQRRELVLMEVAWNNVRERDAPFNVIELGPSVKAVALRLRVDEKDAAEILARTMVDTGLLEDDVEGHSIRFIHRSFLDYFAGLYLTNEAPSRWAETVRSLGQERSKERVEEAIVFACGLFPASIVEDRLQRVRDSGFLDHFLRGCLESHSYPNEFVATVRLQIGSLPRSDESGPLDFARVATFSRILKDYQRVCDVLGQPTRVSTQTLFTHLTRNDRDEIPALIERLAAVDIGLGWDAIEALDASSSSISSERLVTACFEPGGLTFALDQYEGRLIKTEWAQVLAEAALRSSFVSKRLSGRETDSISTTSRVPWPIRKTMYAEVLQHAMGAPTIDARKFPHLALFASAPKFSSRALDFIRSSTTFPALLMFGAAFTLSVQLNVTNADTRLWSIPLSALTYALLVRTALRARHVVTSMPVLLNLAPADDSISRSFGRSVRPILAPSLTFNRLTFGRYPRPTPASYDDEVGPRMDGAVFSRSWPFVWTVFCPYRGHNALSPTCAAVLQHLPTPFLRGLFTGEFREPQSAPSRSGTDATPSAAS